SLLFGLSFYTDLVYKIFRKAESILSIIFNKKLRSYNCISGFFVVPPGIEPGYQVPETCILSVVLRDQLLQMYYIIETKKFSIVHTNESCSSITVSNLKIIAHAASLTLNKSI